MKIYSKSDQIRQAIREAVRGEQYSVRNAASHLSRTMSDTALEKMARFIK